MNPQNDAADPRATVFVTANAGSGKTSTLVNRVARLLLDGASPERILCVTYTKAAAAEMQGRLFQQLGKWAVLNDDDLRTELLKIDEGERDLATARALFARALETPGGLKIQTIHGFCEKLLRRFPLEAGLSPAFSVLDDLQGRELAEKAVDAVLADEGTVAEARDRLIRLLRPMGFEKLMGQFIHQHDKIFAAFEAFKTSAESDGGHWLNTLFAGLGLNEVIFPDAVDAEVFDSLDWGTIKELAASLATVKDKTSPANAAIWLQLYTDHQAGHNDAETLLGLFYTAKMEPRAKFYTNGVAEADKQFLDRLAPIAAALLERRNAARVAEQTFLTIQLFTTFSGIYQDVKRQSGLLDFQDLITRAKQLLATRAQSDWVLFKMDGGLEHILVDEAQDTSDDQWQIVKALSEAFYDGNIDRARTVFAVGDEKQSIYGFQGARPDRFLETRQYYILRAKAAGLSVRVPELITSYRSLPHILAFVDAVFGEGELSFALNFSSDQIEHVAHRIDKGLVELWPQVMPIDDAEDDETPEDEEDKPVDAAPKSPQQRLAQQIAGHIAEEIAAGCGVHTRDGQRAMQAGDVLILVRKRDALFNHIIRELKTSGVPVSGADRLQLASHIAFDDLRALLRFCLQPKDDLSLAVILRSPLCDVSETDLFDLCRARDNARAPSLWQALLDHTRDDGAFDAAKVFLGWAVKSAPRLTAFDFLNAALNRRDANGLSQRQRFLTRLGAECEDVLDETLGLAQMAEGAGRVGLSAFLDLCEFNATEIKREQEEGGHRVRVMTVHGSKGLEAPWVILPVGPVHTSTRNEDLLMIAEPEAGPLANRTAPELYLKSGPKALDPQRLKTLKEEKTRKDDQEALRLYYVALTRARDRLTVCGYRGKRAGKQGTFDPWYDLAEQAFARLPEGEVTARKLKAHADFAIEGADDVIEVLTYGQPAPGLPRAEEVHSARPPLPPYTQGQEVAADEAKAVWRAISQLGDEDRSETERAPSPLQKGTAGGLGRYRRGLLIHKLFEILPDLSEAQRQRVAETYLAKQPDLDDDMRTEIAGAVMAVLEDARFAEAFGPQSRAEVAIAGEVVAGLKLSGRIDRLVVTDERVLVIDYKSNRPAPDRAEDAAIDYQRQMAGYVALLRKVYPAKRVESALLWTDGPKLTPLSETLVNLRLSEIMAH
jgi:ATP-dependent helicase/nuclease subunit A